MAVGSRYLRVVLLLLALSTSVSCRLRHNGRLTTVRPHHRNDICDETAKESSILCFCRSRSGSALFTSAVCHVLLDSKHSEPEWGPFAEQPTIKNLSLNVRGSAELHDMPTDVLTMLPILETFALRHAAIDELPPYALGNSSSLRQATLECNQIQTLAPSSFAYLPQLQQLCLADNHIHNIQQDVFVDLPELHTLDLRSNNLYHLEANVFSNLQSLVELDLSRNNLRRLDRNAWVGLESLSVLNLAGNSLLALAEGTFHLLKGLRELRLNGNGLRVVWEMTFHGLRSLEVLDLADNNLTTLPQGFLFACMPRLRVLDLTANQLITVTSATMQPLMDNMSNGSASLQLAGNRFRCDCHITWVHRLYFETGSLNVRDSLLELTCRKHLRDEIASKQTPTEEDSTCCCTKYETHRVLDIPPDQLQCPDLGQESPPRIQGVDNIDYLEADNERWRAEVGGYNRRASSGAGVTSVTALVAVLVGTHPMVQ